VCFIKAIGQEIVIFCKSFPDIIESFQVPDPFADLVEIVCCKDFAGYGGQYIGLFFRSGPQVGKLAYYQRVYSGKSILKYSSLSWRSSFSSSMVL
jgi:hypothetical protein